MRNRDVAEIRAIAVEINDLINDLNATVVALQGILASTSTSRQEDEPDERRSATS